MGDRVPLTLQRVNADCTPAVPIEDECAGKVRSPLASGVWIPLGAQHSEVS